MSKLEELLESQAADDGEGAPASDGLFDALAGVKKAPSSAPAAAARKSRKRAAPVSTSATLIRNAIELIDPEAGGEVAAGVAEPPRAKRRPRRLADAIPRPNGELYYPRVLSAEGLTDVEVLKEARQRDIRALLYGFPGCGKTALCEAAFGEDLMVANGHADFEVSDLVGSYIPEPDGSYRWEYGPLVVAMQEGRPLLVDDATLVPPGVIARLYPAMDGRRLIYVREHEGEPIHATEGFFVVAAHNPNAPGAVLSEALASRFALHVHVESDLKLARDVLGVNHKAVKVAAALRTARDQGDGFGWAPEMRELLDFKRIEEAFGEATAVANLISTAPAEAREEVLAVIRTWHPDAQALALRGGMASEEK